MSVDVPPLQLALLTEDFSIHRLHPEAEIPDGLLDRPWVFVSRTSKELSIVCPAECGIEADEVSTPWRALEVAGPLDFSLVGILATLTETLADDGVSVFAISTFDTDYLLMTADQTDRGIEALKRAGHSVE